VILPIGVYGCFVFGMIVDGLDPEGGYGSLIIIIGSILSVLGGGLEVLRDFKTTMKERREAVKALKAALNGEHVEYEEDSEKDQFKFVQKECDRVFLAYDYDGSEELGANELMDIVKALYPEIDHTTRNMLITKARKAVDLTAHEELGLSDFIQFVTKSWELTRMMLAPAASGRQAFDRRSLARMDTAALKMPSAGLPAPKGSTVPPASGVPDEVNAQEEGAPVAALDALSSPRSGVGIVPFGTCGSEAAASNGAENGPEKAAKDDGTRRRHQTKTHRRRSTDKSRAPPVAEMSAADRPDPVMH
jgi:hypothetical protein